MFEQGIFSSDFSLHHPTLHKVEMYWLCTDNWLKFVVLVDNILV